MKSKERSWTDHVGSGVRALAAHLQLVLTQQSVPASNGPARTDGSAQTMTESPLEFHRRMFAIITAVQSGIWEKGVQQLMGYATDYGPGQERGVQTLVLRTRGRSAYVRLHWDMIMSDADECRQHVAASVRAAIGQLA